MRFRFFFFRGKGRRVGAMLHLWILLHQQSTISGSGYLYTVYLEQMEEGEQTVSLFFEVAFSWCCHRESTSFMLQRASSSCSWSHISTLPPMSPFPPLETALIKEGEVRMQWKFVTLEFYRAPPFFSFSYLSIVWSRLVSKCAMI